VEKELKVGDIFKDKSRNVIYEIKDITICQEPFSS